MFARATRAACAMDGHPRTRRRRFPGPHPDASRVCQARSSDAGGEGDWDAAQDKLVTFPDPRSDLPPLDRLGGFRSDGRRLYRRALVAVQTVTGGETAWIYHMAHVRQGQRVRGDTWPSSAVHDDIAWNRELPWRLTKALHIGGRGVVSLMSCLFASTMPHSEKCLVAAIAVRAVVERDHTRPESGSGDQLQPEGSGEQPHHVRSARQVPLPQVTDRQS